MQNEKMTRRTFFNRRRYSINQPPRPSLALSNRQGFSVSRMYHEDNLEDAIKERDTLKNLGYRAKVVDVPVSASSEYEPKVAVVFMKG